MDIRSQAVLQSSHSSPVLSSPWERLPHTTASACRFRGPKDLIVLSGHLKMSHLNFWEIRYSPKVPLIYFSQQNHFNSIHVNQPYFMPGTEQGPGDRYINENDFLKLTILSRNSGHWQFVI